MLARFGGGSLLAAVLLLASACGERELADRWSAQAIGASQSELHPGLVNSQLGVGPNRLAFAIYGKDGTLIHDATARVRLYRLDGDRGEAAGQLELHASTLREDLAHKHTDGSTHAHNDPLITVYAGAADLNRTEWWGAELDVTRGGKRYETVRLRFFVLAHTSEPAIGGPAPRTQQLVLRDVDDIVRIDSSLPPRPALHQQTVAEAIAIGKPVVIAFATPAFCQTRFCGPIVDSVAAPLMPEYEGRVSFIHIEPYDLDKARAGTLVPVAAMEQWGLTTEPWVFVVDAHGEVAAKFEGVASSDELRAALDRTLQSKPVSGR